MAYLVLISTPAKTVIQTGQLGAIFLADTLVVRFLSNLLYQFMQLNIMRAQGLSHIRRMGI